MDRETQFRCKIPQQQVSLLFVDQTRLQDTTSIGENYHNFKSGKDMLFLLDKITINATRK